MNKKKKKAGQVLLQCLHQFLFEYWKVAQKMAEEQQKESKQDKAYSK